MLPAPGLRPRSVGIDRVAVRGDEAGTGPDAIRRDGEAHVRQLRVEPDDHRVRRPGRRPRIDPIAAHECRRVGGRRDLEAGVPQLSLETARAQGEDATDVRLVIREVERRGPRRRHDAIRLDRTAHGREAGDVLGAIPHRVVRHVDDVIAEGRPRREHRGHSGHRIRAAVDDPVEVDEQEEAGRGGCHGDRIVAGPTGVSSPALARRAGPNVERGPPEHSESGASPDDWTVGRAKHRRTAPSADVWPRWAGQAGGV